MLDDEKVPKGHKMPEKIHMKTNNNLLYVELPSWYHLNSV